MLPITEAIRATAKAKLIRMIVAVSIIGVLMVIAALVYLSSSDALPVSIVIPVVLGVFFSVLLGAGLMAIGFYSERSGTDDDVAGAATERDRTIPPA